MGQLLMVPMPGVFVPMVGSCLLFPCPGCSGEVRLEGAYAATTALQNLGFGGFSLQQHLPEVNACVFFLCRSCHTWAGW